MEGLSEAAKAVVGHDIKPMDRVVVAMVDSAAKGHLQKTIKRTQKLQSSEVDALQQQSEAPEPDYLNVGNDEQFGVLMLAVIMFCMAHG